MEWELILTPWSANPWKYVTLGLTASIQIHPPEWLENQRVASGGGQSEGMSSQFRPKNGYFLAFIVVVSKRKADGT